MMTFAKIVYWLLSIVAAAMLVMTAALLVEISYSPTRAPDDWWLHVLSLALLAILIWFAGWLFRYVVRNLTLSQ